MEVLRVDEPVHGFNPGDQRTDEDREHDRIPGPTLAPFAPQQERDAQRNRRERIAAVVDQIREQRH